MPPNSERGVLAPFSTNTGRKKPTRHPAYFRAVFKTALLLTSLLALAACNKLPRETTKGKNTFGCRVDGKVWNTYTDHTLDRAIEPEYQTGYFVLTAERDTRPRGGRFSFILVDTAGLRTRTYAGFKDGFSATYTSWDHNHDLFVLDTTDASATLTLTRMTPPATPDGKAIVSGTFSFTVVSPNTGERIQVTDGRFDVEAL